MLFDFLKLINKKKKPIKTGDIVLVKTEFINNFPNITKQSILTVQKVENKKAIVVYMSDKGDKIFKESLPVEAIYKTG